MSVRELERETYQDIWTLDGYGTYAPGERFADIFCELVGSERGTVLDAGCGSGKGGVALSSRGFFVTLTDLTADGLVPETNILPFIESCLWDRLTAKFSADWVYCCDVLEHVPPPFTMLVVSRLLEVARRGVFLSIALEKDEFGAWVGKPLHQTLQSFTAWRDQLAELADVVEARDLLNTGIYFLRPRC